MSCERRANGGNAERRHARGHARVVVALNRDTVDSGARQCARPRLQTPPAAGLRRPKAARHSCFCASRAHAVAANGESASADRDGRHDQLLSAASLRLLAHTATLNASTRASIGQLRRVDARPRWVLCLDGFMI